MNFAFFLENTLLGVGLAMDAFSVSMANGLNEPGMPKKKLHTVAGMFGLFQYLMPIIGWVCVHTLVGLFTSLQKFIPWIALLLLLYIGGKMLIEGIQNKGGESSSCPLGWKGLIVQAIATSIDALSVGFTIASYNVLEANVSSLIIGVTTYLISVAGVYIGKKFGTKLAGKAGILGGVILIAIGIKIFVEGVF